MRELEELAASNGCRQAGDTAEAKRFRLARDVRAVEKELGRELTPEELIGMLDEWYRVSQPFLPPGETRDDHLELFLTELRKVRVPTGEGDTLNKHLKPFRSFQTPNCRLFPDYRTPRRVGAGWQRFTARCRSDAETGRTS